MTWVDWLVILFIILGILQGFWRGFFAQLVQIIAIIVALIVSFWLFPPVADWMEKQFLLPIAVARPLSLVIIFCIASYAFQFVGSIVARLIAPVTQTNPINRALGAVLGGLRLAFTLSVILTVLVTLPLSPSLKGPIESARFAKPLIQLSVKLEQLLGRWFQNDSLNALSYKIVGTEDTTTTSLNYTVADAKEDVESEAKLFALINFTRQKDNKSVLKPDEKLRAAARAHARDMLAKGYFSHLSPQGEDVADRVTAAGAVATVVGENLANAPTVEIGHAGLFASEGHRKILLSPDFNAVGVAVLDAGSHGKMIVEVFANVP